MATKPVEIEILMRDRLSGGLDKAGRKVDELKTKTSGASSEMERLERQADSVRSTVSKIAGAFAVKELVSNIVKVRGEFQQLEASFTTMLGSEEKADALMQQLIRTAATTPFDLQGVANGARQLLAYGENVENVNDDLVRLGNIAAGLNQPLGDLVYLYGTTMTQGRLYTQDFNQFVGRGIPLGRELASVLGVAESKVREMVEAGRVGFPEVQKALQNLTNEGGMFYNLMEEQSRTITGRISNIEDSISMMFNEIGRRSEGIIGDSLDAVAYLVDHYEQVGRVLLGLVGTYGAYKTAVMAVTAMQALQTAGVGALTVAETLHYGWLVIVEKAQKLLNATMLANPYVLVATAIAGVVAVMVSMKTEAERLKEAEESYEAQKQKVIEAEEEHRRKIEELCSIAGDEAVSTDARREALNRLEQKYPDIFARYDTEYEKLKNIKKIKEEIAALEGQRSVTNPVNELKRVEDRIKELEGKTRLETEYYQDSYGRQKSRYVRKSARSRDEETELKSLQNRKDVLQKQIRKDAVNDYFENLTGVSNETLARQIRQRETLLAQMTMQEKKYGKITQGNVALTGTYSRDELQYQQNKLKSEQNRRNLPTDSSADWAASARQKYQESLKAYNDFIKSTSNDLTKEDFEKKAKELKDAADTAKKEYDKVKPGTDKDAAKQEKASDKQKEAQRKLNDELLSLRLQNQQEETALMEEGTEKRLKQIEDDYNARRDALRRQAEKMKKENRESGVTDLNAGGLTQAQQDEIDKAYGLAEEKRKKDTGEAYRAEAAAMRDFLKEYGTYQQQKLAIAEEYAEKIRKAQNEGERLTLEKQRDSAIRNVDMEALSRKIDWGDVFGDLTGMLGEQLKGLLKELKAYTKTDKFKQSPETDKKTVYDAIERIGNMVPGGEGTLDFKELKERMEQLGDAVTRVRDAEVRQDLAYANLQKAQDEYAEALEKADPEEIFRKKQAVDLARTAANAADANYKDAVGEMRSLGEGVKRSSKDTVDGLDAVASGLKGFASGTLQGSFNGIRNMLDGLSKLNIGGKVGDAVDSLASSLSNAGAIGQIISAILGILDVLKDGIGTLVSSLIDTVLGAVAGIIENILKGKFVVQILDSLKDGIGNILDAVTFGGFSSWFSSGNGKEVQASIDRLTDRNESLQQSIEDLTDTIKGGEGTRSVAAYQQAYGYQAETNQNYLDIAKEQAGYHGSHGSWNHYWGGFSADQIAKLSEQIGRQWDGSLWSLSPEEMKILRSNVDMWKKIQDTGKGGYGGRLTEKLDDYIDQAGKLEELEEQLNESLTQVSFDSLYDSFINTLMDMDASAEEIAGNVSEYFMQAILSNRIGEKYKERLKAWYDDFADAMKDNDLSEEEVGSLTASFQNIVEEAVALRDKLAEATGYTSDSEGTSQSGKTGTYTAMSQEQGTKLEGLWTTSAMHLSSMDEQMQDVSQQMGSAVDSLRRIEENTGNSAKHLGEIKEDIKKIVRDGLKMK